MAKYKRYDYSQSVLLPVSLEEQLVPGTLEFAIHNLYFFCTFMHPIRTLQEKRDYIKNLTP